MIFFTFKNLNNCRKNRTKYNATPEIQNPIVLLAAPLVANTSQATHVMEAPAW